MLALHESDVRKHANTRRLVTAKPLVHDAECIAKCLTNWAVNEGDVRGMDLIWRLERKAG